MSQSFSTHNIIKNHYRFNRYMVATCWRTVTARLGKLLLGYSQLDKKLSCIALAIPNTWSRGIQNCLLDFTLKATFNLN